MMRGIENKKQGKQKKKRSAYALKYAERSWWSSPLWLLHCLHAQTKKVVEDVQRVPSVGIGFFVKRKQSVSQFDP